MGGYCRELTSVRRIGNMGKQDSSPPPLDVHNARLEQMKAEIDYVKYLSALSTGAIVLMIAFVKDVFSDPAATNFLLTSLTSFGGVVLSSIVFLTGSLLEKWEDSLGKGRASNIVNLQAGALIGAWGCFIIGVATLLVFAFQNFLKV